MVERIDVLLPPANRSGYGVLPRFTRDFVKALCRLGVDCRLLGNQEGPTPNLPSLILRDSPDCTLSFNGLLPDEKGNFLCDAIQIPHVAYLVDSPNKFLSLTQSHLNVVSFVDQAWASFFGGFHHNETLFMPHAVDKDFQGDLDAPRPYDVVCFATGPDIIERRNSWQEWFSPGIREVMEIGAEIALADQETSYLDAFFQAMDARMKSHGDIDPENIDFSDVLDNFECYIRGKDRLALILSIRDVKVDIFGVQSGSQGWDYYLKDASPNLVYHGRLPYPETLEVLKQSRLVINSCPSIKQGAHERIFAGFLAGASVLSNDNPYIRSLFKPNEEIFLYRHDGYDNVNDQIVELLADEDKRRQGVREAQKKVLAGHTWDHRARTLLDHLDKVLPTLVK